MCRYSVRNYRTHWACVPCRHVAKHHRVHQGPGPHCPTCRAELVDLGRDFHAPRRGDDRQWRKLEALLARPPQRNWLGQAVAEPPLFDSCGCTGPGHRPRTLADAANELGLRRVHRRHYAPR